MAKRRSRGDGALYWNEQRQRWTAEVTVGYRANGKRITRKISGTTKTEAKEKLRELLRERDEGDSYQHGYTVGDAVTDWLTYGLNNRSAKTIEKYTYLARTHVIPDLGARKLRDPNHKRELTPEDVDSWLAGKAKKLATRTLRELYAILRRSIHRAQSRGKVKRNVVLMCEVPNGTGGRPSKSLTFAQAEAVLKASEGTSMHAYIVLSLLTGARTEELRPLTWCHADLVGDPDADPPVPPHIRVWRSVRDDGDTKTRKSRRSIALPQRCVAALREHQRLQATAQAKAGSRWHDTGLVFASTVGSELDAANIRRAFRRVVKKAGLAPKEWTPRELRHSFASLLSDKGLPIEQISRLMGHNGTAVTELVYRHQLRPVVEYGAEAMDEIFGKPDDD